MAARPALLELRDPSASDLDRLVAIRGHALVTIMLDTPCDAPLGIGNLARFEQLVATAAVRVRQEPCGDAELGWTGPELWSQLRGQVMGHGLVVVLGAGVAQAFRLPFAPGDRVVVDPTFATRELAQTVWEERELLLLVLSTFEARLFAARRQRVEAVESVSWPLRNDLRPERAERGRRDRPVRPSSAGLDAFLRRVDAELHEVMAGRPVVLLAAEPVASRMVKLSRFTFLGTVAGNRQHASLRELSELVEPLRSAHLSGLRQLGLQRLDAAIGGWQGAVGVAEVWDAASAGRVETLLVDPNFRWAGTVDGAELHPAPDPGTPGVIDDVVDDLIESVSLRGGSVCFVEPGDLGVAGVRAVLRH